MDAVPWPPGESEMAERVRRFDWDATPLGPIDTWPAELRSAATSVLDTSFPAALVWGPDLVTIYNDGFLPILGDKPEPLGRSFADIWSEAWHEIGPIVERAFAGQSTFIQDFQLVINRTGEPEQAFFTFSYSPVRAADGSVVGMIDTVMETTADVLGRERLRQSEQRFRALVNASYNAVYRMSPDWTEMRELDGRGLVVDTPTPSETWIRKYVHPDDQPELISAIDEATRTKSVFDLEHRVRLADGGLGWIHSRAVPMFDANGDIVEWVGAANDITARKRAEQRQTMLMAELDHRVKNVLALVQSIARQSLAREGDCGAEAAERLIGRLSALAQSHALLASSRWEGASFSQLVENAVGPYRSRGADRILIGGPDLQVTPRAAQTLALALHELVTNAVKHGALGAEEGSVTIEWDLQGGGDERYLLLAWTEAGGPPIERPPEHRGFGSRLIGQTLSYELEGNVELDFARSGFRAEFRLPLSALSQGLEVRAVGGVTAPPASGRAAGLAGRRVLLVEDQHLVAEEMVEVLRAAGCTVVGPVPTLSRALCASAAEPLDAAVLDINLGGELVWPAARALRARNVPFVFTTGYTGTIEPPCELSKAPWVEKPVQPAQLLTTLVDVLAGIE